MRYIDRTHIENNLSELNSREQEDLATRVVFDSIEKVLNCMSSADCIFSDRPREDSLVGRPFPHESK